MRMRNVYVITATDKDDKYVIGAFSSMKKAMEFMEKYRRGLDYFLDPVYGYGISRIKVNDESYGIKANCKLQNAKMGRYK